MSTCTTSTNAAPTKNAGFCFFDAVDNVGKSIEEATHGVSRVRSEMDRLIYEHSEFLDRMTSSDNAANNEEDIPTDAFEVLPLGKDEVSVMESTYQREPVLLQSAINDVRAIYEEGAEEVSRLCRNQSLIAKHLVQKSVGHLLPPSKKEDHPNQSLVIDNKIGSGTAQPDPILNGPPVKEITFESDSDSASGGIPQFDDFQQLYSAFTKSFTKEEADESTCKSNGSEADYTYVPVATPEVVREHIAHVEDAEDESLTLRDWKSEQTEDSNSIDEDSILHLLSQDADDEETADEGDEVRDKIDMDIAIENEKEVLSQIFNELKQMEEDAKKADKERRLRESEFEEAAKVRITLLMNVS